MSIGNSAAQRSARAALDAARPAVARLDAARGSEDLAADLIETWSAVEAALRALVGASEASALTGQALIREARQRQMLNFDQANSLAEFESVHTRLHDTSYRPTQADVSSARNAYLKLDAALMGDLIEAPRTGPAAPATATTSTPPVAPSEPVVVATPVRRYPGWLLPAVVVGVIIIVIAGYFAFGSRGNSSVDQGVAAYKAGQREVALSAFTKASREDPKAVLPHVWMARMARDVGNFTLAGQELSTALQLDPNNAIALREMGANMLQQGNAELARRFYVRAVTADPADKTSQGYLGCALMRLNRVQDATNFLNRAGPGPWSSCTPPAPGTQPGTQPLTQAPAQIPR